MMKKEQITNEKLLQCNFRQPLATTLKFILEKSLPEDLEDLNQKKTNFGFGSLIRNYYGLLGLRHWGLSVPIDVGQIIESANALTREYYSTQWFVNDEFEAREMLKSPNNEQFEDNWYHFFKKAFFFAALSNNHENLELISNWTGSWFVSSRIMPTDPMWSKILVYVASSFRTIPLEGKDELQTLIDVESKSGPKELFESWKFALAKNQEGFESELLKSLKAFEASLSKQPFINSSEPIAEIHSIVLAAARLIGMALPKFDQRTMARLLTAESVGLAAESKNSNNR